ncbi:universal stress protein [Pararhizobium haloflavum]|uniref:universal stress protein n=1 Tax=Pararhizobium haloflavum TaxID=2037914 RepID=UPI00130010E1|nr:universal stress protein [Pararhizobium haloflavum]
MKNILVPIPEAHPVDTVLDGAVALGRMFDSCIEGIALAPDLSRTIAAEFPIDPHYIDPDNRRQLVADARNAFERYMQQAAIGRYGDTGIGYEWNVRELGEDSRIASYARLFDLVALARPAQSRDGPRIATVETVLFESGRPVLLVPPVKAESIGSRVVIAWNGSPETARTIAFAMPILLKAERVVVLALEGWEVDGPSASDQVRLLARHGMKVELATRPAAQAPGEAILRYAKEMDADLIVKGAYTQSRLRQMIFGGATSFLLSHTDVPMLIAH